MPAHPEHINIAEAVRGIRAFFRMRHYRGHGIHSPFVYTLVRRVFVENAWLGEDMELYRRLRGMGVRKQAAARIQNIYTFCGFGSFSFGYDARPDTFYIITPTADAGQVRMLFSDPGATFVVLSPYSNTAVLPACREIAGRGARLTIDARRFFIIFEEGRLPKQHFKL